MSVIKLKLGVGAIVLTLFPVIFMLSTDISQAALIAQSEVDDWSSSEFYYMQMVLTNDGSPYYPEVIYDSALLYVGLYDLSVEIANLDLGYAAQEILDAFTAAIEQPPLGEIAYGWNVSGKNESGGIILTHDPVAYDLWTSADASNDFVLTLSLDKKYLGPNATLVLAHNYYEDFNAFDQYGYLHTDMSNTYRLVIPEPSSLLISLCVIALIRPTRKSYSH